MKTTSVTPSSAFGPTFVAALLFALAPLPACESEEAAPPDDTGGGSGGSPFDPTPTQSQWTLETIDTAGVGHQTQLAVAPDGTIGVAYFSTQGRADGLCEELGDDPPQRIVWDLHYQQLVGGTWDKELVLAVPLVGSPVGLDLAFSPESQAVVGTMGGEPLALLNYCGANDATLLWRDAPGTWTPETAVANSGEAASGQPASDFGSVVGYWASVAFDPDGNPAVAYKDVHNGSIQSDDFGRADLELGWRQGGGWNAIPVDVGAGAGNFNQLAFDKQGRPVIVYHNPKGEIIGSKHGVWVARSEDQGATWQMVQLMVGTTAETPALLIHPEDGSIWVAYYKGADGLPYVANLVDDSNFESLSDGWVQKEVGDHLYDEGYYPNLAVTKRGDIALAYYRCARATDGIGNCNQNTDALVFAWEEGGVWEREVVDEGAGGNCGMYPALGMTSSGEPVIAYQCSAETDEGYEYQLKFAKRKAL